MCYLQFSIQQVIQPFSVQHFMVQHCLVQFSTVQHFNVQIFLYSILLYSISLRYPTVHHFLYILLKVQQVYVKHYFAYIHYWPPTSGGLYGRLGLNGGKGGGRLGARARARPRAIHIAYLDSATWSSFLTGKRLSIHDAIGTGWDQLLLPTHWSHALYLVVWCLYILLVLSVLYSVALVPLGSLIVSLDAGGSLHEQQHPGNERLAACRSFSVVIFQFPITSEWALNSFLAACISLFQFSLTLLPIWI